MSTVTGSTESTDFADEALQAEPRLRLATRFERGEQFLPFAQHDLDESEFQEIRETLTADWQQAGSKSRQFEDEFAQHIGVQHAIAVNSSTAALHLSLEALGIGRGDEVITTPYTFATTGEVIQYFDARPVFVDIEPDGLTIDPNLLEAAITERTKAILPVHIAGQPAEMDRITAIAKRRGLSVIEDATHAFPAKYNGTTIGRFSTATCFGVGSSVPGGAGAGGMICTDNDGLAARCRMTRDHGIQREDSTGPRAGGNWFYEILMPGYDYKMSDITAAVGIGQLRKADRMWRRRREIAMTYNAVLSGLAELQTPSDRADCQHAWQLYLLRINRRHLKIDRAEFLEQLRRRNIGGSVHFIPLHLHPYYRGTYGYAPEHFPVANSEFEREVSLPIYSKLTDDDVQRVLDAVVDIVEKNRR